MRIGSLFSGVGLLELGLEWAISDAEILWQVESEPYPRSVLERWYPNATRHETVIGLRGAALARVDLVCGGFPCQDVSVAGKRLDNPIEAERTGLWREFARILGELDPKPRFVVVENVPRLVAKGLDRVVDDLRRLGYRVFARFISAADVGAPHRRKRLFLVADRGWDGVGQADARDDRREGHAPEYGLLGDGEVPRGRHAARRGVDRGVGQADANGNALRLAEQRRPRRRARDLCDGGVAESRHDRSEGGRAVESGLGGVAHGSPGRVDRWPAGRGMAQHGWEPPRSVQGKDLARRPRLKALGNGVVPQCAYEVGLFVMSLMRGEIG